MLELMEMKLPIDEKTTLDGLNHLITEQRIHYLETVKRQWQAFLIASTFYVLSVSAVYTKGVELTKFSMWGAIIGAISEYYKRTKI